jgi:hypothetical protein
LPFSKDIKPILNLQESVQYCRMIIAPTDGGVAKGTRQQISAAMSVEKMLQVSLLIFWKKEQPRNRVIARLIMNMIFNFRLNEQCKDIGRKLMF